MTSVRQALEFVCKTISDSETMEHVSRHGSRAEALASKAHDMHSRCLEALDGEPQPITKKLSEILADNNDLDLRVLAIKRGTSKMFVLYPNRRLLQSVGGVEMRWSEDYNAWSHRPASGVYQQIIIFVSEDE